MSRGLAEAAGAFALGTLAFALVAVTVAATSFHALDIVLGVLYVAVVGLIARYWGVAYAVPAAMAALLAYDWFEFPPTHAHEFPSSEDLLNLVVYLAVAVLVGELAAYAARRAEVSEVARSELADEQAALRRVATLVALREPPEIVFNAVAEEVGRLLDVDSAGIIRYPTDNSVIAVATWSTDGESLDVEGEWPLDGTSLAQDIRRLGAPARIGSSVGTPIVVEGRVWGALMVHSRRTGPLPPDTESRVANFSGLVAAGLSDTASRGELAELAREQAALRRVATLVAEGAAPSQVFAAVAREVGEVLDVDATHIGQYQHDHTVVGVGSWSRAGDHLPVGTRATLEGESVTSLVYRTGLPARVDTYYDASGSIAAQIHRELGMRSSVGAPIVVEGELWGVMIASSKTRDPLPPEAEARIGEFTELVATAISNVEARSEAGRLAQEQAALRRVATLVAQEPPPNEVFRVVTEEVGRLLAVSDARMIRYDPGPAATVVGVWGEFAEMLPLGVTLAVAGHNVTSLVFRTAGAARINDYSAATGEVGEHVRAVGIRTAVGAPITVGGRLWGAIIVASGEPGSIPANTESRIAEFTDLVATAISNMEASSELAASRARIVAAADEERQRVVRDLHDGAQQRLVHTVMTLKLATRALEQKENPSALVGEALTQAERATAELRELAHGIMPSVLTHGGLRAGVDALASRMPVPVENDVAVARLPARIEATAYFVVAEALTNVAKHSLAQHSTVTARIEDDALHVGVRDDGIGGAKPDGSGLVGLRDRLAVLEGRLEIESPADGGTLVAASIPLP